MSAASRAEARRKAILSRGTDRLAKLTTSARGEDGGTYLNGSAPSLASNTSNFLGEETSNMPTPQRVSPTPGASLKQPSSTGLRSTSGPATFASPPTSTASSDPLFSPPPASASTATSGTPHNPSAWLPEQQQQFMQALMHAAAGGTGASLPGLSSPIGDPALPLDFNGGSPLDNPFASLLGAGARVPPGIRSASAGAASPGFGAADAGDPPIPPALAQLLAGGDPSQGFAQQPPKKPKTILQKLLPLLHLLAIWTVLAYFVLFAEPKIYQESIHCVDVGFGGCRSIWNRWAELGQRTIVKEGLRPFMIQIVPLFSIYVTLQLVLHSIHYFLGFDAVALPTLVQLALPSLPPPIPKIVVNSLKYIKMGSLFLDDLSGLVVGVGLVVWASGWVGPSGVAIPNATATS